MLSHNVMIRDVVTARKENTVQECIEILFKKNVGSAVIVDEDQKCIGIFTERDAIRVVAQHIPLNTPLEKVMSKNIYTVSEDASFHEARATMRSNKIRHLPVVDSKGRLVGLISLRNLYDEFFEEAKRFVNS